jgi:Na+/H+ antiporter NhaB
MITGFTVYHKITGTTLRTPSASRSNDKTHPRGTRTNEDIYDYLTSDLRKLNQTLQMHSGSGTAKSR